MGFDRQDGDMGEQLKNVWLWVDKDALRAEWSQLQDEGRDRTVLAGEFADLDQLTDDELFDADAQSRAAAFLDAGQTLPFRADYSFVEPSDLEEIRQLRPPGPRKFKHALAGDVVADRIHGAWIGRCAGCLLGKPVEGIHSPELWSFLKETGQWPLRDYIRYDAAGGIRDRYAEIFRRGEAIPASGMPVDDDTNYTTCGVLIVSQYGPDFTPVDVAQFWQSNLPLLATCTAERVAYRNFGLHVQPPASASWRNPYREWIGAQIRADGFAYVTVGQPERASEFAWRDACISHIKNGIYGEMFVAAMIAAALYVDSIGDLITVGLSEIPSQCRLAEDIRQAIRWRDEGLDYDEAVGRIHGRWDEKKAYDWCHTNSNAVICAVALLWGGENFGRSICMAVQAGFDTDCNGATVGSILGMRLGTAGIGSQWADRLDDTLHTSLAGRNVVQISQMARETFGLYKTIR